MAVLIQDMEFPESCADCRFLKFDHLSPGCSVAFCLACSQVVPDEDRERPDWCPLKRVGDSASADTLIRELRRYAELYESGENLGHEIQDTDVLMAEAANRLERYEKAKETGRLMELPCKVGDTLWRLDGKALTVLQITIDDDVGVYCKLADEKKGNLHAASERFEFPAGRIGKEIFSSQTEAEAALQTRKGRAP